MKTLHLQKRNISYSHVELISTLALQNRTFAENAPHARISLIHAESGHFHITYTGHKT